MKEELFDKNDALEKWCKENLPENFFKDTSDNLAQYIQILNGFLLKKNIILLMR